MFIYSGVTLSKLKLYEKAIDYFNIVIEIDPQNEDAYYNRG